MGNETFSYQAHKGGVLRIFWEGRCVITLGGSRGEKLLSQLGAAEFEEDVQALLQRATGNFKRGNERRG
ncbi:MAG: hypothetical protein WBO46_06405, partial [Caldilineaceae bacterium]